MYLVWFGHYGFKIVLEIRALISRGATSFVGPVRATSGGALREGFNYSARVRQCVWYIIVYRGQTYDHAASCYIGCEYFGLSVIRVIGVISRGLCRLYTGLRVTLGVQIRCWVGVSLARTWVIVYGAIRFFKGQWG